ncbi:MAG: response regulator transcription factor [Bacteroidetes bacterium]|nr:MAG: response regulator transcription factor [Bacteroidota bacterium]
MKVLIADDHAIVREGLKMLLKRLDSVSSIDEASTGFEALYKLENNDYSIAIIDISMPGISGIDILKTLKDKNIKGKFLILSVHRQEQYALRAFKLGASGYICKDTVYDELLHAIKTVLSGRKYVSPILAEKIVLTKQHADNDALHQKLSEREFQVMTMLARGYSVKEIAALLFISDKTVSTHRMRILDKMGMKKNAELITYALKNDLIE